MKMSRLERALRRARPYVHNPERFPDASNIGKRFRVERDTARPDRIGRVGLCELPLPENRLRLKFEGEPEGGNWGEYPLTDLTAL